jgi:hypothetical protein
MTDPTAPDPNVRPAAPPTPKPPVKEVPQKHAILGNCTGPRWRYSATFPQGKLVKDDAEEAALEGGPWFNNPKLVNK